MSVLKFEELDKLFKKLFPIPRSLMGKAVNESLSILNYYMDMDFLRFKTGDKFDDWSVPKEWELKNLSLSDGKKNYLDFQKNNLSVVYYSHSLNVSGTGKDLLDYIYYSDLLYDAVPYITSYYSRNSGVSLSYNIFKSVRICIIKT